MGQWGGGRKHRLFKCLCTKYVTKKKVQCVASKSLRVQCLDTG